MSSILDALRKVEEGKGKRRRGGADPFSCFPSPGSPPTGGGRRRYLLLFVILVSAGGGALASFLLVRPGDDVSQGGRVSPSPAVQLSAPAAPATPSPGGVPRDPPPGATPVKTGKGGASPPIPPPEPPKKVQKVPPSPLPPVTEVQAVQEIRAVDPPPSSAPSARQPAAGGKTERAHRVSGIGWQKDASARYAVINGTAVTEGGMVDGARVVEIHPDRVVLEENGATREVHLGR